MIAVPPPDPALGDMSVALDGAAMAALLSRSLETSGNDDGTVERCEPYYARYRPEKYCRVQYRLFLARDGSAPSNPQVAHITLYPPKRAERLRARRRLEEGGALYIDDLHGFVQLYPTDVHLPALREAASPEGMGLRLGRSLPVAPGSDPRACGVNLVRYKAGKRAVLRYGLNGAGAVTVYGKLRKDGGGRLPQVADAFRRAGIATPEVLAHLPELGMSIQAEGTGTRLKDLRNTDRYAGAMRPVAEKLAELHAAEIDGLRPLSLEDEARDMMAEAYTVGRLLPHLAGEMASLGPRLCRALALIEGAIGTVHGSFHDDQVLVGDQQKVVFVDLDGAGLGNPLSDVAHFLSYLAADGAKEAYDRFLAAYMQIRPGTADDIAVFEAASLVRWATLPFRELRSDWPQAVEHRVRRAADLLDRYERAPTGIRAR